MPLPLRDPTPGQALPDDAAPRAPKVIRIVRPPKGPEPAENRAAWVGLELPVIRRAYAFMPAHGTPPSLYGGLAWLLRGWLTGRLRPTRGYVVDAALVLELLASRSAPTMERWRQGGGMDGKPHPGVFIAAKDCEELPAGDGPPRPD